MRRIKRVPAKRRYAFVVEGECEFWYVQMLKRNEKSINVNLEPKIPQKKKLSEQYELVMELSRDYDEVYWLIDFDVIDKETRLAKKGKKTAIIEFKEYFNKIKRNHKKIHVIINNPCLEFWILLHFEPTSKYFENCQRVIDQLKKKRYLSDYEKSQRYYTKQGNDIYLKLKPYLKNAIANSKKLRMLDFENPHSGLSQMHFIFETDNLKKLLE